MAGPLSLPTPLRFGGRVIPPDPFHSPTLCCGDLRAEVAAALRRLILKTDPAIGEEIKWNAPTFFYTGPLPPFKPKTYRRVLVVFNFFKPPCIRLMFWGASQVTDPSGLLTGDYADGRRLAVIDDLAAVKARSKALQSVLRQQLQRMDAN